MKRVIFIILILLISIPGSQANIIDDITDFLNFWSDPESYQVTSYTYENLKTWNYEASEGNVIFQVTHELDPGTSVNETYYYGSKSIDIDFSYQHSGFTNTYYFSITNETGTYQGNYSEYSLFPGTKTFKVSYVMDESGYSGLSVYVDLGFSNYYLKPGLDSMDDSLEITPVYRVTGISDNYIDLTIETVPYQGFQESKSETEEIATGQNPLAWLTEIMTIWGVVSALFYSLYWILKTIFVDNIFLTLMFFESFALIYSMQARSIMGWWRRMIKFHKGFIEFTIDFLSKLIQIISNVISTIIKIIKPTG